MKKFILMAVAVIATQSAVAQNVSFEAYKIADIFMNSSGQTVIMTMGMVAQKLEAEFVQKGVSTDAAQRFGRELKGLTQTDYGKAYAALISEHYSADEQRTLLSFLESDLGKKYVNSSKPESPMTKAFGQVLTREVCKRANLTNRDVQGVC